MLTMAYRGQRSSFATGDDIGYRHLTMGSGFFARPNLNVSWAHIAFLAKFQVCYLRISLLMAHIMVVVGKHFTPLLIVV